MTGTIEEALANSIARKKDVVFGPCDDLTTLIQIAIICRNNHCHPAISSFYGSRGIVIAHTTFGVCDA